MILGGRSLHDQFLGGAEDGPVCCVSAKGVHMTNDPLDPNSDPFRPPETPVEVSCLHCGREYDSYLIEWRVLTGRDGKEHGFWCCPTPGCDGMGFGFDILPTDLNYRDERGGWISDDEEGEEDSETEWDDFESTDNFLCPPVDDGAFLRLPPEADDEDIPF
jgi:hypothetical protein